MAGYQEKKHRFIIWGQNHLKQLLDGPLHWEMVVAEFFETFETWPSFQYFGNAEWIRRQWVEMFLKKCASEVQEVGKKGMWGTKQPAMDLGDHMGNQARGNIPQLPNTTFMVVIRQVPNAKNDQTSSNRLQALYTDVRHLEEMIDFIEKSCSPKESYCLTAIFRCNFMQEELDKKYMQLYALWQMMNYPSYGLISYNSSLSNAFMLKLRHNVPLLLFKTMAATGMNIAEHVMRSARVITASHDMVSCTHC